MEKADFKETEGKAGGNWEYARMSMEKEFTLANAAAFLESAGFYVRQAKEESDAAVTVTIAPKKTMEKKIFDAVKNSTLPFMPFPDLFKKPGETADGEGLAADIDLIGGGYHAAYNVAFAGKAFERIVALAVEMGGRLRGGKDPKYIPRFRIEEEMVKITVTFVLPVSDPAECGAQCDGQSKPEEIGE